MTRASFAVLFLFGLTTSVVSQTAPAAQKPLPEVTSGPELAAIVNLRKFAMAESEFAMSHPQEGFACDPQVLTKLEWPISPNHVKLVDAALLSGEGQYKFSAQCENNSKPSGKLNVLAIPVDPAAHLRTFCATGSFGPYEEKPYFATGGFEIRSIAGAKPDSCLVSGQPLQ